MASRRGLPNLFLNVIDAADGGDKVGEFVFHSVARCGQVEHAAVVALLARGLGGRPTHDIAAVVDVHVAGCGQMVDLDGAALAFDLRGQQVIRDLGMCKLDGDAAAAVAGEDGTAAVDGSVRELLRGGIQQRSHAGEAGGHAEDLDHGLDSVDADIHEGPRCHVAVEDIGGTSRENLVVARRIFAKAQRSAANGRNLA